MLFINKIDILYKLGQSVTIMEEMSVSRNRYIIEPTYKKCACEEQSWTNTLSSGKSVVVKVFNVYRWGKFYIDLTDEEKEKLLAQEMVDLSEYEHELIEMWDGGCDFWIETVDEASYSDGEQDEIETLLYKWKGDVPDDEDEDDDGYSYDKMEHNAWFESDCNVVLTSKCELHKVMENVEVECI
ncbi:MAG: hypothetical protein ACR2M6_00170 [Vampirovibrionia bacterium]|jgi:hypothetical protein